jgi:Thioesterase-like superfamily
MADGGRCHHYAGPGGGVDPARVALVHGEEPSPLQRLFTVADSGSGISNFLDPRRWWFINSELTVHLRRPPVGEWIGMDAVTTIGPGGVGTATSTLRDLGGEVGIAAQALTVRPGDGSRTRMGYVPRHLSGLH